MFDPLPKGSAKVVPLRPPAPEWRAIMPVPPDAAPPPDKHPKLGAPVMRWQYRDADGRLLGLVDRYPLPGGVKEIRSLLYAEHKKFGRQWRWLGFPKPRPLYGLDRLAARPGAPVVVTEGEKAADAAAELLPDHVTVTSPGGSKAAKTANWSALAGRQVVIWPDADEPGLAYAEQTAALLARLSPAPTVAIVMPPAGLVAGWDAADALAAGWTAGQAAELIAAAVPASAAEPPAGIAGGGGGRPPARGRLLELLDEVELWHDADRIPYVTVPVDDHRENCEVNSPAFRRWLAWRAYQANGGTPAAEAIEASVRLAEALALNTGPLLATWRRVAEHQGRIYVDLGCARWRAVEITAQGRNVVDNPPPKFLRSRGMERLPEPDTGETIELLREFLNVESDGDFRLILAWLVAAMRPAGPFPILVIAGQQGASKSTVSRICRALIDPSSSPIRSVPKDERDLLVSAFNSWQLVYDNLSVVPAWLSDAWCRLSTGGGFATRQLHSDRDETIFSATRPIVINGIGDLASRPDLADRAISITLPPLPDETRRPERLFWADFERARPLIFGALLDAVAAGLRHLADIKLDRTPRMADFATWVEACAPGFGWPPGEFLRDYDENRRDVVAAAAEASPLVPLIEAMLGRGGLLAEGFDGTAADLLAKLAEVASEPQQKARWYPSTAAQAGSKLRIVAPLLRSRGILFETYKDRDRKRTRRIVLRCVSEAVFDELRTRFMGRRAEC